MLEAGNRTQDVVIPAASAEAIKQIEDVPVKLELADPRGMIGEESGNVWFKSDPFTLPGSPGSFTVSANHIANKTKSVSLKWTPPAEAQADGGEDRSVSFVFSFKLDKLDIHVGDALHDEIAPEIQGRQGHWIRGCFPGLIPEGAVGSDIRPAIFPLLGGIMSKLTYAGPMDELSAKDARGYEAGTGRSLGDVLEEIKVEALRVFQGTGTGGGGKLPVIM